MAAKIRSSHAPLSAAFVAFWVIVFHVIASVVIGSDRMVDIGVGQAMGVAVGWFLWSDWKR